MATGDSLIGHFVQPLAWKTISDHFNTLFAITKTGESSIIVSIPLINQKQFIANLKIRNQI